MKHTKCLLMVFAALAGTILFADLSLNAQSLGLRVNIPFEFHVGDKALPAGTYIVEKRGEALLISDRQGKSAAILSNAIGNKAHKLDDMVVFHRYGDNRFLSEVRWSEYSTARGVLPSKTERRLANLMGAETVKLAAIVR